MTAAFLCNTRQIVLIIKMNPLNHFAGDLLKPVLIQFGLATCLPVLFAMDIHTLPGAAKKINLTASGIS